MKSLITFGWNLFLTLHFIGLHAQNITPPPVDGAVKVQYKYYGDSVVLRWGYTDPLLWKKMIQQKVQVWRRDVTNKGEYIKLGEIIPWDSTKIELMASTIRNPEMLVVVLENLYRNWQNTYFTDYTTIIEKSDNFYNRWSLIHLAADLDPLAANAAGLRFVDKSIQKNITYAYKIIADGKTDYKTCFPVKRNVAPIIYNVAEGESKVDVFWDKKLHDYHFTSYWFESSLDGIQYTRINAQPYVQMTEKNLNIDQRFYSFSIPTPNYQKKHFRIVGLDAFGDESTPSNPVQAMGRDKTPPESPQLFIDSLRTHLTKHLSWTMENYTDLDALHLERSNGENKIILTNFVNTSLFSFIDTLNEEGIYKYRLIAVDTAGNESFSSPVYTRVYDLIPPEISTGLRAITDTSGYILLTWDQHKEKDVIGYNVYASDNKDRNFIKMNNLTHRERIYLDSINVNLLTTERYYYIVAVDNDFMRSLPSDTIRILRPDRTPPSPALIADYNVDKNGIRLTIFPSSSRDVVLHEVWRKNNESAWVMIQSFTIIPKFYLDSNVVAGEDYYYKVLAVDNQGLKSKVVKEIKLSAFHVNENPPVISYKIQDSLIHFTISTEKNFKKSYIIYKALNDKKLTRYEKIEGVQFTEPILTGKNYKYRVRSMDEKGKLSPFSNELFIQI